jgi:hypothetical protein
MCGDELLIDPAQAPARVVDHLTLLDRPAAMVR